MKTFSCIYFFVCVAYAVSTPLVTEYQWKYFDYEWKSPEQKRWYMEHGYYEPKNMAPIDVDRAPDGRTFVTVIRDSGVPASVHTISRKYGDSGPLLKPYPSWAWYESNDCDDIISVYRVAIDKCNRIWVLDTGVVGEERVCRAKLLAFSLHTDELIFKMVIPDHVAQNGKGDGLLVTPIIETYGYLCHNTTVYMADVTGNALVIWNGYRLFRLEADVFKPREKDANITIAGESFYLTDGVLGMALSPVQYPEEARYLAFRPLASRSLYGADTRVLKRSNEGNMVRYYRGIDVLPSQAAAMAFSAEGTLLYGLTREIAIGCWNLNRPLRPEFFRIALRDPERLQFISGMKILREPIYFPHAEEEVLMLSNRFQKLFLQTLNLHDINFRILRIPVKSLIRGTVCDKY